ncbi:MAG TPA: bifunctional phosphopantothenoylcysteine decarboxylase/phosphopantothenate--cysteine ligase CoaBC [Firmicutes bacterium]|nr:bifunctional phosphopantothenoylcysteine decarboxylase/phosphopantothenate--cysteine ligase CoaBC [Bacillota bacterium]
MGGSYKGKHVLLGVTGGIAAYKVPELIRALQGREITVEVIMTKAACEFVTPLTLREITGLPVHTEMFSPPAQWRTAHISLARKADLLAVIPATANIIGKITAGIADDLLTTTVMATRAPVLIAPAMNTAMYENPVFRRNLETLSGLGYRIVPAATGDLLCGEKGAGRLPSLDVLEEEVLRLLSPKDLAGKRLLITAGPTREYLDPVRFITNDSSGRMGYALAKEAYRRGGQVTLVAGKTSLPHPPGVKILPVTTTGELYETVMAELPAADIIIMAGAPVDFSPVTVSSKKIKKTEEGALAPVNLRLTPDVARAVGEKKDGRFLAIFAAETNDLVANAREKIGRKQADLAVANDLTEEGAGFQHPTNKVTLVTREEVKELPLMSKEEVAKEIISTILRLQEGKNL